MTKYLVHFEGPLMDPHMSKLNLAEGVFLKSSSTLAGKGTPRHTASAEASSSKAAADLVADALGADAGKFRNWSVEKT